MSTGAKCPAEPKAATLARLPAARLIAPASTVLLQRTTCRCGQPIVAGGECANCRRRRLQRSASGAAPSRVPPSVEAVLASPGTPLDPATRSDMETRFGHDFSRVRIHDGEPAAASAHDVHARAYTVGHDIVFGRGQFAPRSPSGRALLAHELAHTVQQSGLQRAPAGGISLDSGSEYQRLEHNAETAAAAALRGEPVHVTPATDPVLSRVPDPPAPTEVAPPPPIASPATPTAGAGPRSLTTSIGAYEVTPAGEQPGAAPAGPRQRRFLVNTFYLPGTKGQPALALYQRRASSQQLQAIVQITGSSARRTALWQDRASPANLGAAWIQAVGWTAANRDSNWAALAGGAPFPQARGVTCNMDHIVELQLAAGNDPQNMQALDPEPNQSAGRTIWTQVRELGTAIAEEFSVPSGDQVQMIFGSISPPATFEPHTTVPGQPNSCLMIDQAARAGATTAPTASAAGAPPEKRVRLEAGATAGIANNFVVPVDWGAANRNAPLSGNPSNAAAAQMISGLVLEQLSHTGQNSGTVAARFDPRADTRLPITVAAERNNPLNLNATKTGGTPDAPAYALRLAAATTNIQFTYPYLSPGAITRITPAADGTISWSGYISPSVPFLPRRLDIAYQNGELRVTTALDRSRLRSPLPGFRLTDARLDLILAPDLRAEGSLAFVLGTGTRPLASGTVRIGADSNGLNGEGTLAANIPGVDDASATITYRAGAWSAQIVIESSQIRLPYVERGRLQLDIDREGLRPSGELALLLPRNLGHATLGFHREAGRFIYTGRGRLRVPGLREVDINARYDGDVLRATASDIGFTWRGLDGRVSVTYTARRGEPGSVTGTGSLTLNRGNVAGSIEVTLHNSGRFSGRGRVTYPFNIRGTRLEASAGITVDEQQNVRVDGSLRFPQPIELFRRFGDDRRLFHIQRNIPIPGASIGPVGIVAVIEGGVSARYGFGPGQLRNVEIAAAFNPLAPEPDPSVRFHGQLHIPASAGITGTIGGGIGVDAGLGSVTGTVTVSAALDLNATLSSALDARYERSRFEFSARPSINASLDLGLSLDAHARAQAGIGRFSVATEKTWNLGRRAVTLGRFSMTAPVSWSSDGGFNAPTMEQIEWGPPPQIDPPALLRQLFSGASASER